MNESTAAPGSSVDDLPSTRSTFTSRRLGHIAALDGLRGVAIGVVVLYHLRIQPFVRGGYIGVEIFFVLSGFLITTLLLSEHDRSERISLRNFYMRRLLRLGPALLLALAVVAVAAIFLPDERAHMLRGVPTAFFYIANWVKAFGLYNFEPLHHTWSLAIEEQFYLVWPLLLLLIFKALPRREHQVWGVVGLAGFFLMERFAMIATHPTVSRIYHGTDTRAIGLLTGCVLAFAWSLEWRSLRWLSHPLVGVVSLVGLLVLAAILPYDMRPVAIGLLAVDLLTVGLILAALSGRGIVSSILRWRPLVGLGVVSYGVYLWHDVIYLLVRPDVPRPLALVIQFALIAAIVAFSWRFIEKPVLRMKQRYEDQRPGDVLLYHPDEGGDPAHGPAPSKGQAPPQP